MTQEQKKKLLKAQQGELDAVILYRKLAEVSENEEVKEMLLKIAADEGKHATIIRDYTKELLVPEYKKANLVLRIYKILGHNFTMKMLSNGELKSATEYSKLVNDFPKIQEIIDDEKKHSDIAKSLINKK